MTCRAPIPLLYLPILHQTHLLHPSTQLLALCFPFSHFALIPLFLCNIASFLPEQIPQSLPLLSSIPEVLDLFTPLAHLYTYSFIFLPPSTLQNPISEHHVEKLQNIL